MAHTRICASMSCWDFGKATPGPLALEPWMSRDHKGTSSVRWCKVSFIYSVVLSIKTEASGRLDTRSVTKVSPTPSSWKLKRTQRRLSSRRCWPSPGKINFCCHYYPRYLFFPGWSPAFPVPRSYVLGPDLLGSFGHDVLCFPSVWCIFLGLGKMWGGQFRIPDLRAEELA